MVIQKPLILVGMPGSGKSTVGQALAQKTQLPFEDSDSTIEDWESLSVPEIFDQKGEEAFRLLEKKWAQSLPEKPCVLATGGGLPCFHENMATLKAKGRVVYLKIEPDRLAARLVKTQLADRPLLEDDLVALEEKLEKLYQKRASIYEQADLILETDGEPVENIVGQILEKV